MKGTRSRFIGEAGYILYDTLFGIGIFTMGMVSIFTLSGEISRENSEGLKFLAATVIARNYLEYFKNSDYDSLEDIGEPDGEEGPLDISGNENQSGLFTVRWDIVENYPQNDMKGIEVMVLWMGDNRDERALKLCTVKGRF